MQDASTAYKTAMKNQWRNRAYIKSVLGVINLTAQRSAVPSGDFAFFSSEPALVDDMEDATNIYATAEEKFAKADGSMFFLPEDASAGYYNQGIVTTDIFGTVKFTFGTADLRIKGLTIDFGEYYPTAFTVAGESNSFDYTNDSSIFTCKDIFESTQWITITATEMVGGQQRLRINTIQFGIGEQITNSTLKTFSWKDYTSSVCESLPTIDVTIEVYNYDGKYDVDDDDNITSFMETGQEIQTQFGYELDDGTIEWIDMGVSYLKSRTSDDSTAKFVATDLFENLTDKYYGGTYSTGGITLYDAAVDVLSDMRITDYYLDPYLKEVTIHNPIPVKTHKVCLQLIANAGRCTLSQDRSNRISLHSSFVPDITAVESNSEAYWSNVENVMDTETEKVHYANASQNYTSTASGVNIFLPADSTDVGFTGYVSDIVSDEDGLFETDPTVTIDLEASLMTYGLTINFDTVYPQEMTIETSFDGTVQETLTITETSEKTVITRQFKEFDNIVFTFTKGSANSRIFIDSIVFGDATDYTLEYQNDLLDVPTCTRDKILKEIDCYKTIYMKQDNTKQVLTISLEATATDMTYTAQFTSAASDLTVAISDATSETVSITSSTSFSAELSLSGLTVGNTYEVVISGVGFDTETVAVVKSYNTTGETKEWTNPLISEDSHALDVAEWVGDYYSNQVSYELSTRGDPRIDSNDLFYLERKDIDTQLIRCYENDLSYSGAWSAKMKCRRVTEA